MLDTIYLASIAFFFCALVYLRSRFSKNLLLPPGPKPLPLIGNVYDVPREAAWRVFAQWGQKYGDIVYLNTFGKSVIILNSAAVAHDLLDTKSLIYSHRPYFAMASDVIGWNWALPVMEYGEKFKKHRKYLHHYFQTRRLPNYYVLQTREAHRLLSDFVDSPKDYADHIKRMAGGITMMLAYGHSVTSVDDPFISIAEKGVLTIDAAGAVGAHIVDFLPWLRFIPDWMPGAGIKRLPPGTKEALRDFVNIPFDQVKKQMAEGTALPSYTANMLEETKGSDEEGIRNTAAITYSAGFDTTLSTFFTALIALVSDPVVQTRVQAEMDLVVGKDRLPSFEDRPRMPYMQCIVSETFRWGSTTPVGVPHKLSEDDFYNGMHLPAGSMVLANAWGMLHDPNIYPEPDKFNPDRFLQGNGCTPQPDPRGPAFGFGRRICPGREFAENSLWIAIASIFYAFRITPACDDNGVQIPIDLEFSEHSVRHPKPFQCTIKPRRENSVILIRQAVEAEA